jgi:hypothetical protein
MLLSLLADGSDILIPCQEVCVRSLDVTPYIMAERYAIVSDEVAASIVRIEMSQAEKL